MALNINQKRQDTVFGYIRKASFKKGIPKSIIVICVLFYGNAMDYFKHFSKGQWIIKDNGKTIIRSGYNEGTVYASNVLKCNTNMVYKWSVKINPLLNYWCCIGIDESNHTHQNTCFYSQNDSSFHYGYGSMHGSKYDSNGKESAYLSRYTTRDTVNMCVDTEKNTISFSKNNKKLTKAFNIKPTKNGYLLAISAWSNEDSFSILSFTKYNKNRKETNELNK
eukprot:355348_1